MKKLITTVLTVLIGLQLFAQEQASGVVETFEGSGKIYVVVACVMLILVGLIVFLFSIERRLKKLEKKS